VGSAIASEDYFMKVRPWRMVCVFVLSGAACATFILLPLGTPPAVAHAFEVILEIGASKGTIAPPESATAGSTWIEFAVTYKNRGQQSVWIHGYSADNVFYQLETRAEKQEKWAAHGMGYCGTGAQMWEIHSGESHSFTVALPERYRGQELRVVLDCHASESAREPTRAASLPRKVTVAE
jgi:hypothetical protein